MYKPSQYAVETPRLLNDCDGLNFDRNITGILNNPLHVLNINILAMCISEGVIVKHIDLEVAEKILAALLSLCLLLKR